MKFIEATVLVTSLFTTGSEARKRLVQDETDMFLQSPFVEAATGDLKCLFKNENNSWCLSTETPMMNAGWTYAQKFDKVSIKNADGTAGTLNYYMITLLPYIQPYF
jgi:hypothetical protein